MGAQRSRRGPTPRGRHVSRRDFIKWSGAGLAGAAALSSTACSEIASGFAASSVAGPNTLVLSKGPDTTGTVQKMVDRFNKEDHKFKVAWQIMSADTGQYFDKMRTEFQVGRSEIDVIGADVIWPAQFAANKWIEDLGDLFTEQMQQDFLSATIETSSYNGRIYGVPWYSDAGLLYYRKDLLDKAGLKPPRTWEELHDQAAKVREQEGIRDGFTFQGAEYEGGVCNQCEYVWNAGGEILAPDDPTKVMVGAQEAVRGYESALANVESGTSPLGVATYKELESLTVFIQGDSVFNRNWPFAYAVATGGPAEGSSLKPEWVGVSQIPTLNEGDQSVACLGGWDFCISALSTKKEQAWEFIQWMIQPEIQKFQAVNAGYLPPRKSLFEDEKLTTKDQPVMSLAKPSYDSTKPRPSVNPFYSDMSLDMAQAFNDTIKGDASAAEAVRRLESKLDRIAQAAETIFGLGGGAA
jgi:multiple sugar transport system substrate-binding protein